MQQIEIILLALGGCLILALFWLGLLLKKVLENQRDNKAFTLLQNELHAGALQTGQHLDTMRQHIHHINTELLKALEGSQKNVSDRLEGTSRTIQHVHQQLGKLDESSQRIFAIGKDVEQLQRILQSPKLRGNLSELLLVDLLAQVLPQEHYRSQYRFQSGECVDAVIQLESGIVSVDAKFPLENFVRLLDEKDEAKRKTLRKEFLRDVKIHIDTIATKYIRTDESTFDFALMYIPAENVYYEIILQDNSDSVSILEYALKKRVIPVSPNSFYAYLQTIILGLKGLKIDKNIREIINSISAVKKEMERFSTSFKLLGNHLMHAAKKYEESEKRLEIFEAKLEHTEGIFPAKKSDFAGKKNTQENTIP